MNKSRLLCNNKGFSLVELLIVVAIALVLAAIAIPQFQEYKTKAKNAEMVTHMQNLRTAVKAGQTNIKDTLSGNAVVHKRFGASLVENGTTAIELTPGFPWSDIDDALYIYANRNPTCISNSCYRIRVFAGSCETGNRYMHIVKGDGETLTFDGYSSWFDSFC